MIAADVMSQVPAFTTVDATLASAIGVLREVDVRHLPVVSSDREVVGMLSDRDLHVFYGDLGEPESVVSLRRKHHLNSPVSQVMSGNVFSVNIETDVKEIIELMLEQRIGAVPVVDAERRLRGIISYVDLLRELRRRLSTES